MRVSECWCSIAFNRHYGMPERGDARSAARAARI